jgi:ZIP family zinc transporter
LDVLPEVIVLGIALRNPGIPLALVIAFALGNFPVALSSTAGMRAAGRSYAYILMLWSAIAVGGTLAIAAGYVGFGSLSGAWPARLQAFGAGALLAMTAETMIPEAFHNSPRFSGLLAAFGFGLLLLVDAAAR